MELHMKLEGIASEKKRITKKNVDGTKSDDMETITTMKLALKKIKYDRDENIKEGTDDPWGRVAISSMDGKVFDEFKTLEMGTEMVVFIEEAE